MQDSSPNSDLVYDLYGGGFFGGFTRIALLLDVFTPLSAGPVSAERVALSCKSSVHGVRAILNYLSSTKVIAFHAETKTYQLTPSAAAFLVPAAKSYAGDWILANTDPVMWQKMLHTIQSGKAAGHTLPWAQDAWLESYSPSRIAYSRELWSTVGIEIEEHQSFHVLDLASGCGIKTMALAQSNHSVMVTCLDSENVLEVARDLGYRLGVESRITFLPADLLSDDFGSNKYEAALLGLITYILTPEQNKDVFQRAHQALKPGGKLVIDAIMASDEPTKWASRATLLMSTWNGGAAHSFADVRAWLEQVGFREVVQHNASLVSAIK
ncbi:MAG: class I SAM-dependent methyltransferase [Chloroflexi bacterium]|nr:class I SAM-dependent methyltransferase [Chloroflexota bacterium]